MANFFMWLTEYRKVSSVYAIPMCVKRSTQPMLTHEGLDAILDHSADAYRLETLNALHLRIGK